MTTPQLAAAHTYLDHGVSVLPLKPDSKRPLGRWKRWQVSRMGHNVAASWWNGVAEPMPGLGVVTGAVSGDLAVLDVEPEHVSYVRSAVRLPDTGLVETARGGLHVYCRGARRSGKLLVGDRVVGDVRGEGGYVVAPPTQTASGSYDWRVPADWTDLSAVPDWVPPDAEREAREGVGSLSYLGGSGSGPHPPRASRSPSGGGGPSLLERLPARSRRAVECPIPSPSWSELVFLIACDVVRVGGELDEMEEMFLLSPIAAHLHEKWKRSPGYLERTYRNAGAEVECEAADAIWVRLFRAVEYGGGLAPMHGGPMARTRGEFLFSIVGTSAVVQHRIPILLADGSISGDYRQYLEAFGLDETSDLIVSRSRARAVVEAGQVQWLLSREAWDVGG